MKNYVFLFVFMLIGTFTFAQSTCSCGTSGNGCSSNCGAGYMATCQGYGGNCSCSCVQVKETQPFGKVEIPNINGEIQICGLINEDAIEKLSGINFRNVETLDNQFSKIYNDFVGKIEKAKTIVNIES
jgi:hypothetical protein